MLLYRNTGELGLVIFMTHLKNLYENTSGMDFSFNYLVQSGSNYDELEIHLSISCLVNFFHDYSKFPCQQLVKAWSEMNFFS